MPVSRRPSLLCSLESSRRVDAVILAFAQCSRDLTRLGACSPPAHSSAQQSAITVTGRVTNEAGAALSLATVYVEALGIGTQTSEDGRYSLVVPAARVRGQQVSLGARAIGFRSMASLITLSGTAITKDFTLTANPLRLGEVVVTGSGTSTTVEKLGNAINSVKAVEIQKSNEPNIVNALAAKAPGVEVTSASGDPGAGSSIVIRGLKTIQGDAQPLFVVDGQPIDNTTTSTNPNDFSASTAATNRAADLNPNDIESIEILKGAAASAIYGARAGTGRRVDHDEERPRRTDALFAAVQLDVGRRQQEHPASALVRARTERQRDRSGMQWTRMLSDGVDLGAAGSRRDAYLRPLG